MEPAHAKDTCALQLDSLELESVEHTRDSSLLDDGAKDSSEHDRLVAAQLDADHVFFNYLIANFIYAFWRKLNDWLISNELLHFVLKFFLCFTV